MQIAVVNRRRARARRRLWPEKRDSSPRTKHWLRGASASLQGQEKSSVDARLGVMQEVRTWTDSWTLSLQSLGQSPPMEQALDCRDSWVH